MFERKKRDYKTAGDYEREARKKGEEEKYWFGKRNKPLKKILEPHSDLARIWEKAGVARRKEGNYGKALKDYEMALEYADKPELKGEIQRKINALPKKRGLEKFFAMMAIGSFIASLFFSSLSITGKSIGVIEEKISFSFGLFFFILGLVFAFLYFYKKRNFLRRKKK